MFLKFRGGQMPPWLRAWMCTGKSNKYNSGDTQRTTLALVKLLKPVTNSAFCSL